MYNKLEYCFNIAGDLSFMLQIRNTTELSGEKIQSIFIDGENIT